MDSDVPPRQLSDYLPTPHAILEAGGELWSVLSEAIVRSIDEITGGQILEIVWADPGAQGTMSAWCGEAGHELIGMLAEPAGTRFWIRKSDGNRPASRGEMNPTPTGLPFTENAASVNGS